MKRPVNFEKIYGTVFETYDFSHNGMECRVTPISFDGNVDVIAITTIDDRPVEHNSETIKSLRISFKWDSDTFSIVKILDKKGRITVADALMIGHKNFSSMDKFIDMLAGHVEVIFFGWISDKRLKFKV
jgi:hypothetical protein